MDESLEFLQAATRDLLALSRELGGNPVIFETAMDLWKMQTTQIMMGSRHDVERAGLGSAVVDREGW